MRERIETILLLMSVVIMMAWFIHTVWSDLLHKDADTIRQEQERETRRLERMEMIKDIE